MILYNDAIQIGDFVGTIPAMIALSKTVDRLVVGLDEDVYTLFDMIPQKYNIQRYMEQGYTDTNRKQIIIVNAKRYADPLGLHMIQSHFPMLGLPMPDGIPRPELEVAPYEDVPIYDYVLAPFGHSLNEDGRWQREKWNQLVRQMPDTSFGFFGDYRRDQQDFIEAPNVTPEFGHDLEEVACIMQHAKRGLLGVPTGITHMAYALSVPTCIIDYQPEPWGINPEAKRIHAKADDITVEDVIHLIT